MNREVPSVAKAALKQGITSWSIVGANAMFLRFTLADKDVIDRKHLQ